MYFIRPLVCYINFLSFRFFWAEGVQSYCLHIISFISCWFLLFLGLLWNMHKNLETGQFNNFGTLNTFSSQPRSLSKTLTIISCKLWRAAKWLLCCSGLCIQWWWDLPSQACPMRPKLTQLTQLTTLYKYPFFFFLISKGNFIQELNNASPSIPEVYSRGPT